MNYKIFSFLHRPLVKKNGDDIIINKMLFLLKENKNDQRKIWKRTIKRFLKNMFIFKYFNERLTLTKAMKVFSFFFFVENDNDKKEMIEKRLQVLYSNRTRNRSFLFSLIHKTIQIIVFIYSH